MTELLFRSDPYASECAARVVGINDRGGIVLDRTVFYATSGGQPGDRGSLALEGVADVAIATAVWSDDRQQVVHVPAAAAGLPSPGAAVLARLDWEIRHRHMRMHTCLHLLCALVRSPVTGGQIGAESGRLDFDIPESAGVDKEQLSQRLNELIVADHEVGERWISEEELAARPELVRTMAVKPPSGAGRIRLVQIGRDGEIDLQPCGGTHVRSTAEIGRVAVDKIEKKGRLNRRIRVVFA